MSNDKDAMRARAEASFKPAVAPVTPATQAKAERDAEAAARDANTERLKQLRLAREAAERDAVETNRARRKLRP